jgi:hypothetical protein
MIFNTLAQDGDMAWMMIDATIVRSHKNVAGAKKGL